ncbi:MAG: sulfurtransferase [Desulfobacterales bacterium]|nr:sulfurtransferase [Desulfobacterales bacterium]
MKNSDFKDLTPETLRGYREEKKEKDYQLIDVRQPGEYGAAHIPGAILIPLPQLESRLFNLPSDRDLVFYCRSGARSRAAANLAVEAEVTTNQVYNLVGGIMGWDGKTLADFPRVEIFDRTAPPRHLLEKAMDLEKGAGLFYDRMARESAGAPFADTFVTLAAAELGHARLVYRFWAKTAEEPPTFETVYADLSGEVLEGGQSLDEACRRLTAISQDRSCIAMMELALDMEYAAFDLYRFAAEMAEAPEAREAFLTIAQAEKGHMKTLIKAIDRCP